MTEQIRRLKEWLTKEKGSLSSQAFDRAANLLLDQESLEEFVILLASVVGAKPDTQLGAVQSWVFASVADDAPLANDWLTLLRLLKAVLWEAMGKEFSPGRTMHYWMDLDPLFNHAFIEVARLAADTNRAVHLEHMREIRRQLDQLNQSKSNFVALAAHELKTPLTLLEGYTQMLRAALPCNPQAFESYLEGFDKGTRRLRMIINDMLDVSLLDAQSLDLHYQPVYLHKLLDGVLYDLRETFQSRHVSLTLEPLVMKSAVYGDPQRLDQALTKVLENSLKYTPDGGRVMISSRRVRENEATADIDGYMDLLIRDTGIGIAPENLTAIFDKFATVHDVSLHSSGKVKFKGGGPGLGLPIARGIVEAHGGRVWAESPGFDEKNCPGSTFHVELPVRVRPPY